MKHKLKIHFGFRGTDSDYNVPHQEKWEQKEN